MVRTRTCARASSSTIRSSTARAYQLLGGGLKDAGWNREHMPKNRLAIIPDLTHYEAFANARMAETVLPFLNGESTAKSSAE